MTSGPRMTPLTLPAPMGAAPCGFQGAVFVLYLTNRRGSIVITETALGWARFLPLWHQWTHSGSPETSGRTARVARAIKAHRSPKKGHLVHSRNGLRPTTGA